VDDNSTGAGAKVGLRDISQKTLAQSRGRILAEVGLRAAGVGFWYSGMTFVLLHKFKREIHGNCHH